MILCETVLVLGVRAQDICSRYKDKKNNSSMGGNFNQQEDENFSKWEKKYFFLIVQLLCGVKRSVIFG